MIRNKITYFNGPLECTKHIYRTKGISGFYYGGVIQLWRDIPACGLYVLIYEFMFNQTSTLSMMDSHGIMASVISGGMAGVVSWATIIPCDVVKSLIQSDITHTRYSGIFDCVFQTYRAQGVRGFFTGLTACSIRAFPVNAITFLVYTQSLKILDPSESHLPAEHHFE